MRTRIALLALTLGGLASAKDGRRTATYQVPVKDPALKAYSEFTLAVKKVDLNAEDKELSLRLEMPEALVGQEPYEVEFRGAYRENAAFVLSARGKSTTDKKPKDHTLSCAYARSEASLTCLAKWHYIKENFNEARLREHLIELDPHASAESLDARVAVARAFSGDGIGVLSLAVVMP